MLWLFVGPAGFTCWIYFALVCSIIYCLVLIFALSPCLSLSLSHWYPGSGVSVVCIDS